MIKTITRDHTIFPPEVMNLKKQTKPLNKKTATPDKKTLQPGQKDIPLDQILFAIPAALFIVSPIFDIFMFFFATILHLESWDSYAFLPYFPTVIAGLFAVALVVRLTAYKDKNLLKKALDRTQTFRIPLILFAVYLILLLVSVAAHGFGGYALRGHHYTKMSVWIYLANVLIYFLASSFIYDGRVKEYLVKGCVVIATFYALYGITQYVFKPYNGGLRGTFHHYNHYGYYLSVSISLTASLLVEALSGKKRGGEGKDALKKAPEWIAWCGMMLVQCVALGYCDTLGAWIAVLFSSIFLFVAWLIKEGRVNWRALVPLALFLATSVALNAFFGSNIFASISETFKDIEEIAAPAALAEAPVDDSAALTVPTDNGVEGIVETETAAEIAGQDMPLGPGSGRWTIWKLTVKNILEKPLFGSGIEGLLDIITSEGAISGSPHNEYLEYMAFFGIPAGLAYIAACLSVFIHALKHKKELNAMTLACLTGGFGYLVSAFFGVCFFYTVSYVFIFLGLSLNFAGKDRPAAES